MTDTPTKPGRGGRRSNQPGRPPKNGERRIQKSVNLTATDWQIITDHQQPDESDSDTLSRVLQTIVRPGRPLWQIVADRDAATD